MTNEELAELERLMDDYDTAKAFRLECDALASLIATAREAEALRAENARLRDAGIGALIAMEEAANVLSDGYIGMARIVRKYHAELSAALEQGEVKCVRCRC